MDDIPTALRILRARLRWKQDRLADQLGVSQATISRWEAGLGVPDKAQVEAIRALIRTTANKKTGE